MWGTKVQDADKPKRLQWEGGGSENVWQVKGWRGLPLLAVIYACLYSSAHTAQCRHCRRLTVSFYKREEKVWKCMLRSLVSLFTLHSNCHLALLVAAKLGTTKVRTGEESVVPCSLYTSGL